MRLFKRRGKRRKTRLFFTTDIHGSDRCFRKFLNAAPVYEADVLVIGGDITGKRICPVVKQPNGTWQAEWAGQRVTLSSPSELEEFDKRAANAGMYAFECGPDEARALDEDPALVEQKFLELASARLEEWMGLAKERLADSDVKLIINCGNDDPFELDAIIEGSGIATFPEGRIVRIDERRVMASVGYANRTPWDCARDIEEEELEERIEAAVAGWKESEDEQLIFNLHPPPHNTSLDQAPLLDSTLKPITEGGQIVTGPVGSHAVRKMIEKHQPLLSLHGHVHESRAVEQLNDTLCVNPGSEYPDGVLRGAVVDLDEAGVSGYVLTSS